MSDDATTFDVPPPSLPPPRRAFVALGAGTAGGVVYLPPGEDVSIGRSSSSGIRLADRGASRLQAILRWDGGDQVRVTDCGSKNGTFVDGKRVEGEALVSSGAEIQVGVAHLVVAVPSVAAGGSPAHDPLEDDLLAACDPAMLRVVAMAERAARSDVTVLLLGESGSGKEVIARFIHRRGARADKPFLAVNCGSIPESLAEAHFFGSERGAYTGAAVQRDGYFFAANGGTLLLDEVAELSAATQARLLRVLEERRVTRVGGTEPFAVDVRIIAATNRDVDAAVRAGRLREDLLFRLDVLRIGIPPLRERPDDVLPLAERFLRELGGDRPFRFASDAATKLRAYDWPGNVRELRNVIERAIALAEHELVRAGDLVLGEGRPTPRGAGVLRHHVEDATRDAIIAALEACGGNQSRAAKRLGISRRSLIYKLERFGLKPPPAPRKD